MCTTIVGAQHARQIPERHLRRLLCAAWLDSGCVFQNI